MRMSLSLRPAKRPVRRGSLPAFLLSILLVSRVPAEDDGLLRIVLDHLPVDCEDRQRGWGCDDEAHQSFVVDGKAIPDRKALDVALRTAAGGDGKSEGSGRRVWVRAEDRVPYTIVWGLLESCSRAGLHRFVWTAAAAGGEKSPAERTASGRPPRDVWIRIEFHIRAFMTQIDDGSWISEDREILEVLRAARVDGQTTAVIDPEGDIPWSEIARRIDLCARSGIEKVEFLGFPPLPAGYSSQVTEGEATALAQALDQAAAEDQAALLDHLVDRHEMFRRMVGTIPLSVPVRHGTASVFVPGILSGRTLPRVQGGSRMLRFLGMNPTAPGVSRPLFRIRTDTGLDYVELVLARRVDGQIRIVDVFSLRRGGLQSEDGRTTLLPSPPVLKILNDMAAPTPVDFLMEEPPALMELFELFKRNAHRELDAFFVEKKEAFKTSRKAHRLHLSSAAQIDADAYLRAVREMKKCFPDDASLLLLELEGAIAKRELEGTLEAADALERRVKRDSHLDLIRAQAHLSAGDPAGARPLAVKATEAEPDFEGGWWLLVEIGLAQKDFKAVVETLSRIEEKLGLEIGDLESSQAYAEFVKSKEYRLWRAAR